MISRDGEEEVPEELHEGVEDATGDVPLEVCRFDDDPAFLAEVARKIAPLAARPGLAPGEAAAIERAVAALKRLPEWTPGISVRIEVSHRLGSEESGETYSYLVKLDQQGIEISSRGSQHDAAVGSNTFSLESLKWYANGQAEQHGNRDTWLERLSYGLSRDYTLSVTT
jgi:hypothetical protein